MTPEQQYVHKKKVFWEVETGAESVIWPADLVMDALQTCIEGEYAYVRVERVEMTQAEFDRLLRETDDEDEDSPSYRERLAHIAKMEQIAAEQTAAQNSPVQQEMLMEVPDDA